MYPSATTVKSDPVRTPSVVILALGTRNDGEHSPDVCRRSGRNLKIDIEGADVMCLEDLIKEEERPNFISIERRPFLSDQMKELALLKALGYTRFKIVDQKAVMHQQPPRPALEGMYADHQFEFDATGLFGEESPGPWLSYAEAIAQNAALQVQSKAFGLWRLIPGLNKLRNSWGSWYDFHAALPEELANASREDEGDAPNEPATLADPTKLRSETIDLIRYSLRKRQSRR
jgi:hypothetical protein